MNKKLTAKLLLGTFIISGLFAQSKNILAFGEDNSDSGYEAASERELPSKPHAKKRHAPSTTSDKENPRYNYEPLAKKPHVPTNASNLDDGYIPDSEYESDQTLSAKEHDMTPSYLPPIPEPTTLYDHFRTTDLIFNVLQSSFYLAIEDNDALAVSTKLENMHDDDVLYFPCLDQLSYNRTLLHVAAIKGDGDKILEYLFTKNKFIKKKAIGLINQQDEFGLTPLHWAAIKNNKSAYDVLLEHGADVTIVDGEYHTAAEYLACHEKN